VGPVRVREGPSSPLVQ